MRIRRQSTATRPAPAYEGRVLPRPEDEVQDQGLAFDIGTMVSRRGMLQMLGIGTAAVGLTACGAAAVAGSGSGTSSGSSSSSSSASSDATGSTETTGDLTEIPEETAGPYPGDGSNGANVLTQSGVVRSDIRSSFGGASGTADGVPMTLKLSVFDLANDAAPFTGAAVYVWHCDRDGQYSLYADGLTEENYLRGVQEVGSDGTVTFTSIFPACYSGRWPHVHFEVYPDLDSITDSSNAIATSQVALPQDVCAKVYASDGYSQSVSNLSQVSLDSDGVFGDDGGVDELGVVSGSVSSGLTVSLDVGVDTTTAAGGGGMSGGGGGGMPGGGPGGGGAPPSGGPGGGMGAPPTSTSTDA